MGNEEFLPDTSISADADLNPDLVGGVMIRATPEQCQVRSVSTNNDIVSRDVARHRLEAILLREKVFIVRVNTSRSRIA
jgi:hypothetical protein